MTNSDNLIVDFHRYESAKRVDINSKYKIKIGKITKINCKKESIYDYKYNV